MLTQLALLLASAVAAPPPPALLFHFMQIQQVIGGVNGDTTAQAIQLRMRTAGQGQVAGTCLRAFDAQGLNPVVLIVLPSNVSNEAQGAKILIASPSFASHTSPAVVPDFTMANLIPASYLAAGSLTFEDSTGSVLWRVSWGGASYTGPTTGSLTNDPDGEFAPSFPGALPSLSAGSLLFKGGAAAASTSNILDYEFTCSPATFRNNAGTTIAVEFAATAYCTAGITSSGCSASMSGTGSPSLSLASGFVISTANVEGQKDGLYFYAFNGAQANTWGNGSSFQCVVPPVLRAGLMPGSGSNGQCDGSFSKDFNSFWASAPVSKLPVAGGTVWMQAWFRDPFNTSNQTTSLSNALHFTVCP